MRALDRLTGALPLILMLCSAAAMAQSPVAQVVACPWLTQGTAAKALGGDISVSVKLGSVTEGVCQFSRLDRPEAFLKVEVSKGVLAGCGAGSTALKGIGNEALRCVLPAGETISGRVRELNFTLTLAGREKSGSESTHEDVLKPIAELVAGNLF